MNRSDETEAVLLMTTRFPHGGNREARSLTVAEWGRFARWLKSKNLTPGCLIKGPVGELLREFDDRSITARRVESLLARGTALALSLEKWERAGIWVMTRFDPDYPSRLKSRLKQNSPATLFGCGDRSLLSGRSLAVVGSRKVGAEGLAYSALLGGMAAREDCSVVSGGAAGVDEAAMFGSLLAGGKAVGVLADSLMRACLKEKYRGHIMDGRLVLVSPYNPEAGFNAGNAMQRNRYIYCMADAAFVVHSAKGRGGTWGGAVENLNGRWVKLWVREDGDRSGGNAALEERGASRAPRQVGELDFAGLLARDETREPETDSYSYETFLDAVREFCGEMARRPAELGELIPVGRSRLNFWLKRAVSENKLEKLSKPVRYQWINQDFSSYESFLERAREFCGNEARRPAELGELIPVSRSRLNAWLRQAVSENKLEKLDKPARYRFSSSAQSELPLLQTT